LESKKEEAIQKGEIRYSKT